MIDDTFHLSPSDATGILADDLLKVAAAYAKTILRQDGICRRPFHNIHHTEQVVLKCTELVSYYGLKAPEAHAILIAAWFHDTGYSLGNGSHERNSVRIVSQFLSDYKSEDKYASVVEDLIMSTCLSSQPKTLGEKILRDCDLHHLGSPDYPQWSKHLQTELTGYFGLDISDEAWNRENIHFLQNHHFLTSYANVHWNEQKRKNLEQLMAAVQR